MTFTPVLVSGLYLSFFPGLVLVHFGRPGLLAAAFG